MKITIDLDNSTVMALKQMMTTFKAPSLEELLAVMIQAVVKPFRR